MQPNYFNERISASPMAIPNHCGMRPLTQNIEGLRVHAFAVNLFQTEAELSAEARKWRSWLVHCLLKAARHYNEARVLVIAQVAEGKRSAAEMTRGRQLPILDFALAMEDCITSLAKIVGCIDKLAKKDAMSGRHVHALKAESDKLRQLRNQQEHMHEQLPAGQTGSGPIYVTVSDDGEGIHLRNLSISFDALYRLMDASYLDVAALLPSHDVNSAPRAAGVTTISMSGTTTVELRPIQPPPRVV